jgi:hypothetical protein
LPGKLGYWQLLWFCNLKERIKIYAKTAIFLAKNEISFENNLGQIAQVNFSSMLLKKEKLIHSSILLLYPATDARAQKARALTTATIKQKWPLLTEGTRLKPR